MAICEDGSVVGSVSGGCIEDDIAARYRELAGNPSPQVLKYGVEAEEAHRFGLPCGGTIELLFEPNPDPALLKSLLNEIGQGHLVKRQIRLCDGQVRLTRVHSSTGLAMDDTTLETTFGPQYRMLLIGAGQLAEYLATMAIFNEFTVTVCDPRSEYNRSWQLTGTTLETGMPDDVVVDFRPDHRSCVIALTHDPKLDDLALLAALHTDAFYVGAIGSRRNDAARRERMERYLEQPPELIAKLRGPVGLYIGSKTPAEIAVSIMAEVIAIRNGITPPTGYSVRAAKDAAEPLHL